MYSQKLHPLTSEDYKERSALSGNDGAAELHHFSLGLRPEIGSDGASQRSL